MTTMYRVGQKLQGEHLKSTPYVTSVDGSAMRVDFCMKFYTTLSMKTCKCSCIFINAYACEKTLTKTKKNI